MMMTSVWDLRARLYDLFEASNFRRGPHKAALFEEMQGRVLFLAAGTGADFKWLPPCREIVAIDISAQMLRRAAARRAAYRGTLTLVRADAMNLCFPGATFDTVATSCTLCSVPDPARTFAELRRVLRPSGRLLMFEHVRSRNRALALALDLMTLFSRRGGTEMNRRTVEAAVKAGFRFTRVESVFLDIILAVRGLRDHPLSMGGDHDSRPDSQTPVLHAGREVDEPEAASLADGGRSVRRRVARTLPDARAGRGREGPGW